MTGFASRAAGLWRGLRADYAVCVGALLIGINHGDAILRGDVSSERLLRMMLTVMVPYSVSTGSSVSALKDRLRDRWAGAEPRTDSPGRR